MIRLQGRAFEGVSQFQLENLMSLSLLIAVVAIGADPLPEAAQKELKLLQGEWKLVAGEKNGKKE